MVYVGLNLNKLHCVFIVMTEHVTRCNNVACLWIYLLAFSFNFLWDLLTITKIEYHQISSVFLPAAFTLWVCICVIKAKCASGDTYCSRKLPQKRSWAQCWYVCGQMLPMGELHKSEEHIHKLHSCVVEIKMKAEFEDGSGQCNDNWVVMCWNVNMFLDVAAGCNTIQRWSQVLRLNAC